MKKGDVVKHSDSKITYGVITSISDGGKFIYIEWIDGTKGWHNIRLFHTKKIQVIHGNG